jgi:DNA-binding NtrC family response regulator
MNERKAVVVDDDAQVLALAGRWLHLAGCEAVMASSFADARVQIELCEPTILIADVRLSGFNGIQLGLLARRVRSDARVLIISGWDDPVLRRETHLMGATFLAKPLRAEQVLSAVGLNASPI